MRDTAPVDDDENLALLKHDADSKMHPSDRIPSPSRYNLSNAQSTHNIIHASDNDDALEKMKAVTYWQGVCLLISRQIGAGIFSSPALVNGNAGSVGMSLVLWFVCGCVAWTGACTHSSLPVNDKRPMRRWALQSRSMGVRRRICNIFTVRCMGSCSPGQ